MKASAANTSAPAESSVRIDKWLWAARFYRTRTLAKEAIEGGKVHCQGDRVKVSKELRLGMALQIRQGFEEKTVVVTALSVIRSNATHAQTLYLETEDSIARRELMRVARQTSNLARPDHRPNKHERQQLQRLQQSGGHERIVDHDLNDGF